MHIPDFRIEDNPVLKFLAGISVKGVKDRESDAVGGTAVSGDSDTPAQVAE